MFIFFEALGEGRKRRRKKEEEAEVVMLLTPLTSI